MAGFTCQYTDNNYLLIFLVIIAIKSVIENNRVLNGIS